MVEYGSVEYYENRLEEFKLEREIYINALVNVAKKEYTDISLILEISKKLNDVGDGWKWAYNGLQEALQKKSNKENGVADDN